MSRKKGKSKGKGSAKTTPRKTPSKRVSSQAWPPQEPSTFKFSLADEARWMANHRSAAFEAGKSLRHMPVQFVSAGHLEGTIKERVPAVEHSDPESDQVQISSPADSSGSADNTSAMAKMAIRSPSPALSVASSSADEVVFRGRGKQKAVTASAVHVDASKQQPAVATPIPDTVKPTIPTMSQLEPDAIPAAGSFNLEMQRKASVQLDSTEKPSERDSDSDSESVVQDEFAKRRGGRSLWEGKTTPWVHRSQPGIGWQPVKGRMVKDTFVKSEASTRDSAMDDYMQNIEEFGHTDDMLTASGFARREMDLDAGSHNDWESASASLDDEPALIEGNDGWDSDDLQDLQDMSTSSEAHGKVVRILSKRTRKSGLHYLCVFQDSSVDDASWLPARSIRSAAERKLIQAFEDEATRRQKLVASSDTSGYDTGDVESDEEEDESQEVTEDEETFDDEAIARALQKQEEMGLGSEEVLLYAGHFVSESDLHASFGASGRSNKKRQGRARNNRDPAFPSASAMADAVEMDPYGGFDIMDTERPSLRQKKKGRRGQLPPELEDEDLNDRLQKTWAADRNKKRLKKAEREELRQQGLLGRKSKGANLKVKYQGGIGMEDIVEEIREFLVSEMQTLSLPPMEANRRAVIHQVAAFFSLTSRSRGDGHDRFTVLAKTNRTRTYTDDEFDIAIQRKGFQKRLRGPLHGQGGRPFKGSTVRHGNRLRPQTGYQDGDTVGANAPELGPENKGHALLSKMGWSKGTGLGALDNKGILQPIAHTVKTNKAGLQ